MDMEDKTCVVRDAFIVTLCTFENGEIIKKHGAFLWAIVIADARGRFNENHFLFSSKILKIVSEVVYTRTGSQYIMSSEPIHFNCRLWEFSMLGAGVHPRELPTQNILNDLFETRFDDELFEAIDNQLKIELDKKLH